LRSDEFADALTQINASSEVRLLLQEIASAAAAFEDQPASAFTAKIGQLRPPKKKASSANKPLKPKPAANDNLVEAYVDELRAQAGDHKLFMEAMQRLIRDKRVKAPDAVAIAAAFGAKSSGKKAALQALESVSVRAQNDRLLSERIRKGG
jgi:hypothetical protein